MKALSVVIITYNEEKNIGRCIDSVRAIADEVVVLDSFSTDATVAIAKEKGAIVHAQAFYGYIAQKNRAIQLAAHDYILSLDADEAVDETLAASILAAKQGFAHRAYTMNRCNWYRGRFIRHGLWYPDRKLRLFDRRVGYCGGMNPHDRIELRQPVPVCHLRGDLLHYTYRTAAEYWERNEEVSQVAAQSLFEKGLGRQWYKPLLSPVWAFVNGYLLRMGFLDGGRGWTIAVNTARQCYRKYELLQQLYRQQPRAGVLKETKSSTT
jgi:glycosyltransferase involved in cell wall biosynthesis